MKHSIYILALVLVTLTSCNSTTSQAKENNAVDVVEKVADNPSVTQNKAKAGAPVKLTKATFLAEVWNYEKSPKEWNFLGDQPAIIDFYADWCGPCRKAAPILEQLSKEYEGKVTIYKIDTQKERELAGVFGISSIPAFLYIPKTGKPMMMAGIGRTDEDTKNMFVENINKYLLSNN